MKRRSGGAKRVDASLFAAMVNDPRSECYVATVEILHGASSHWRLESGPLGRELIVGVVTVPEGIELEALLFANDVWRVPSVGAEVAVIVPGKELGGRPVIVAVGDAPERTGDNRTILVAPDTIEVTAPTVILGPSPESTDPIQDGFVHGRGVDPFTGAPYFALGNTSSHTRGTK